MAKKKQIERLIASIKAIQESNDVYMTIDALLLTSRTNLNRARFTPEFIHEIVENKDFYIGLPLVCEKEKLEKGDFKNLGHALNRNGEFQTEQIGSYVDFYEVEAEDGQWELFGVVRVYKRFEQVCEAIKQLYEDETLFFSVEVYVAEYIKKSDGSREITINSENKLFGDCIVSFPAETKSKAQLLIAEALKIDLQGGEELKYSEFFKDTKLHFETFELDIGQVQRKVFARCIEKLGDEIYNYFATDFGVNFLIMQNWDTGDYYRFDYEIQDHDVSVSDMYQVTKNYMPVGGPMKPEDMPENMMDNENANQDTVDNSEKIEPEQAEINNKGDQDMTLEELQAKLEIANKEIETLNTTITEKDNVIAEKETALSEINEKLNTLSESVVTKDAEIAELNKAKEELDGIKAKEAENEIAEKKVALKDKYSKLLSEEILTSAEVVEAIEALNETVLQAKVVDVALEKASIVKEDNKNTVTASIVDDITVGEGTDIVSKYITINK